MRKTDMGFRAKHGVAGSSWAVANGHALLAGKFYDLPYCIKKVLVDEFQLLRGYNNKHPEVMSEWYIFFGEALRIADNKGVFEEFKARIGYYSDRYPWNISAARPDAVDVSDITPEEAEENERIREEKRLKKKALFKKYYDDVLAKRRGATPRKPPGQSYAARKAREYERRKQLRREGAVVKEKEMADA